MEAGARRGGFPGRQADFQDPDVSEAGLGVSLGSW
jgi:hypothetical protein